MKVVNRPNTYRNNHPQMVYARPIDRKPDRRALWVGLGALVFILPLLLFSGTLIIFQFYQLNLPNVVIFDQPVGFQSREATEALVNRTWNQERTILLMASADANIQYELSPKDLGLWVDPQATADAAFAVGRSSNPSDDLSLAFSGEATVIMPVLYYDEAQAKKTLEAIAEELSLSPVNASVVLQDQTWTTMPGKAGQRVAIDTTLDFLVEDAFAILLAGIAPLQIDTLQPEVVDLSPLLNQIKSVVAEEYRLTAYDPITDQTYQWSIPLETKTTWVTADADTNQARLSIRQPDVEELLRQWAAELGEEHSFDPELDISGLIESWQAGQSPTIAVYYKPTTYQVSQGESLWSISLKLGMPLWYLIDANPGLSIDTISAGMNLTIPSKNILLPLPPVPNKRIVVDISTQRMTVYEDGEIRNTHIISTGVSDSPTMAGIFQVQSHELNAYASNWDLYMPHFLGIYEAWPGFMNGIHGLPLLSSGHRLWASNLGSPASFGCIILTLDAAEDLFYWADPGVVVEIRN
jgi:LysM repeat protein